MKLSICIPVYNFDIQNLVNTLLNQIISQNLDAEIVLIDDKSEDVFQTINNTFSAKIKVIQLPENIGRSKIRNLFLSYATGEYLLFLDCDGKVENNHFISNYLNGINSSSDVICGGRIYPDQPSKNHELNWKFGVFAESKSSIERSKNPYSSFMTNNFIVKRASLERFPFDESIRTYGHEDTLFGYELMKHSIPISHINNPVFNNHIERNDIFLKKSVEAIKNLHRINLQLNNDDTFISSVRLLSFYYSLKKYKLTWLITAFAPIATKRFQSRLKKGNVSLLLFNFYKLGIYHEQVRLSKN